MPFCSGIAMACLLVLAEAANTTGPGCGNICPAIWLPVCGADGNTYSNTCAACGVDVECEGECPCSGGQGEFCGDEKCNLKCGAGEKCVENEEVQCVQAPCCPRWTCTDIPCMGCPQESEVDDDITAAAAHATAFLSGISDSSCGGIKLVKVENAKKQVVAGTNFILTLRLETREGQGCADKTEKICENIVVFKPLPFACKTDDGCLELIRQTDISCKPVQPEDLCLGKPCGAFCDTSSELLQAIRYCQPDGTCGFNSKPNCTVELKEEGESCGSCFCPPTYNAGTCKPGLTCVHHPLIADLPGTCTKTNCETCESMVQGQRCGNNGGPFRMNCTDCCRTSPAQCAEWRCDAGGWLCQKPCPQVDPCSETFAVVGPCEAIFPRWSYNQKTLKCEYFEYGGCEGNDNNFESKQECQRTCEITEVGCEDVRKCNMAFGKGEVGVCIQTNKEGWNVKTNIDWSAPMKTGLCKSKDDTDANCCGCFKEKVDRCEDPKCVSIPKKKIKRECIKKSEDAPANLFNTGRKCMKRDDCFCFQNCKTTKKCVKSGGKCLGKPPQWPYQKAALKPCDRKKKCLCYIPIPLIIPG